MVNSIPNFREAEVTFIGSVIYNTEEVDVNNSHTGVDVDSFPGTQIWS